MNNNFVFDALPDDIIGLILEQKKIIEETEKNKEKFNDTIKDITEQGLHLVVYRYPDGCVPPNSCPYMIYEFGCCSDDDETDED